MTSSLCQSASPAALRNPPPPPTAALASLDGRRLSLTSSPSVASLKMDTMRKSCRWGLRWAIG